jgi:hypothetical protein
VPSVAGRDGNRVGGGRRHFDEAELPARAALRWSGISQQAAAEKAGRGDLDRTRDEAAPTDTRSNHVRNMGIVRFIRADIVCVSHVTLLDAVLRGEAMAPGRRSGGNSFAEW